MSYTGTMKTPKRAATVAEFIKEVRASRGSTQAQLADLIGSSKIYVGHLEQGKYTLPMETLSKLMPMLTKGEKHKLEELVKDITVQMLRGEL